MLGPGDRPLLVAGLEVAGREGKVGADDDGDDDGGYYSWLLLLGLFAE